VNLAYQLSIVTDHRRWLLTVYVSVYDNCIVVNETQLLNVNVGAIL